MSSSDSAHEAPAADDVKLTETPPTTLGGILARLGPGLIIAGSIVGSGELIATTKTGAEAGFSLLWLILIGCVIKVFVQVEMGRYAITSGKTTLHALAEVPGPRIAGRGNWLIWYWALVFLATIGQVGGIIGGVGQALQISVPLTEAGQKFNEQVDRETMYRVAVAELGLAEARAAQGDPAGAARAEEVKAIIDELGPRIVQERFAVAHQQIHAGGAPSELLQEAATLAEERYASFGPKPEAIFELSPDEAASYSKEFRTAFEKLGKRTARDAKIWAFVIACVTAVVLWIGRYGFIQSFATVLVASFTLITIINLGMLQNNDYWAVGASDVIHGMSFQLPPAGVSQTAAVATALATFGIIGVGANELIAYPYWCLEKGYARFTGLRNQTTEWGDRARGWMRVMRWDAWCSMVVYTFATLAFYFLGAAILGRIGLNPAGTNMVRTLGVMYEPVFGTIARWIFLFGAFAVLYSTFFVATASLARVVPDGLRVMGIGATSEEGYRLSIRIFSVIFPFLCVAAYTVWDQPAVLVLIGGVMQGIMLPMLAIAALFFRYKRADSRITPGLIWDTFLWISAIGMLITGIWTVISKISG